MSTIFAVFAVAVALSLASCLLVTAEDVPGKPGLCADIACVASAPSNYQTGGQNIGDARCQWYQDYIIPKLNEALASRGYLTKNYTYYPKAGCYVGSSAYVCGSVAIPKAEYRNATEFMNQLAQQWLNDRQICDPASPVPMLQYFFSGNDCFDMFTNKYCKAPFPPYKCSTETGPPMSVSSVSKEPGRKSSTTLYCFTLQNDTKRDLNSCKNDVFKAEIWANEKYKRNVRGIKLMASDGKTTWKTASWRTKGSNTLGVLMEWSLTQATRGKICYELDTTVALQDFCVTMAEAPNTCYLSLFDSTKDCCPTTAIKLSTLKRL